MKNKFLFLLPSLKTGGGTRVMFELANQLTIKGYNVKFIVPNNSNELHTFYLDQRIEIVLIGIFKNNSIYKLLNLFKALRQSIKSTDSYIILTDPFFSMMAFFLPNKNTYRFLQADDYVIFDDLELLKNKIILRIYKLFVVFSYKYNIHFLFNSQYAYNRFVEISNRKTARFNLVHPAINHRIFKNQNIRSNEKINICIVGRRHPWKGFVDFTRAWSRMENKLKDYVNKIYIISHDDLSSFETSGMSIIRPKNDQEIAHYMNQAHIFISTSWWEGFGLPPLEAMACGCAVLLSDSKGVNEYAIPSINCMMYLPQDIEDLILNLKRLIQDEGLRKNLAIQAVKTSKLFSWEKSSQQLLEIIMQNE